MVKLGIFNNYTNSYFSDRNHETGDFVLSGSVITGGVVHVKVTKAYEAAMELLK